MAGRVSTSRGGLRLGSNRRRRLAPPSGHPSASPSRRPTFLKDWCSLRGRYPTEMGCMGLGVPPNSSDCPDLRTEIMMSALAADILRLLAAPLQLYLTGLLSEDRRFPALLRLLSGGSRSSAQERSPTWTALLPSCLLDRVGGIGL